MKKYKVTGTVQVFIETEVQAESAEDAIDIAYEDMSLTSYCGNGGSDKLVGVCGDVSIDPSDNIEDLNAEEIVD